MCACKLCALVNVYCEQNELLVLTRAFTHGISNVSVLRDLYAVAWCLQMWISSEKSLKECINVPLESSGDSVKVLKQQLKRLIQASRLRLSILPDITFRQAMASVFVGSQRQEFSGDAKQAMASVLQTVSLLLLLNGCAPVEQSQTEEDNVQCQKTGLDFLLVQDDTSLAFVYSHVQEQMQRSKRVYQAQEDLHSQRRSLYWATVAVTCGVWRPAHGENVSSLEQLYTTPWAHGRNDGEESASVSIPVALVATARTLRPAKLPAVMLLLLSLLGQGRVQSEMLTLTTFELDDVGSIASVVTDGGHRLSALSIMAACFCESMHSIMATDTTMELSACVTYPFVEPKLVFMPAVVTRVTKQQLGLQPKIDENSAKAAFCAMLLAFSSKNIQQQAARMIQEAMDLRTWCTAAIDSCRFVGVRDCRLPAVTNATHAALYSLFHVLSLQSRLASGYKIVLDCQQPYPLRDGDMKFCLGVLSDVRCLAMFHVLLSEEILQAVQSQQQCLYCRINQHALELWWTCSGTASLPSIMSTTWKNVIANPEAAAATSALSQTDRICNCGLDTLCRDAITAISNGCAQEADLSAWASKVSHSSPHAHPCLGGHAALARAGYYAEHAVVALSSQATSTIGGAVPASKRVTFTSAKEGTERKLSANHSARSLLLNGLLHLASPNHAWDVFDHYSTSRLFSVSKKHADAAIVSAFSFSSTLIADFLPAHLHLTHDLRDKIVQSCQVVVRNYCALHATMSKACESLLHRIQWIFRTAWVSPVRLSPMGLSTLISRLCRDIAESEMIADNFSTAKEAADSAEKVAVMLQKYPKDTADFIREAIAPLVLALLLVGSRKQPMEDFQALLRCVHRITWMVLETAVACTFSTFTKAVQLAMEATRPEAAMAHLSRTLWQHFESAASQLLQSTADEVSDGKLVVPGMHVNALITAVRPALCDFQPWMESSESQVQYCIDVRSLMAKCVTTAAVRIARHKYAYAVIAPIQQALNLVSNEVTLAIQSASAQCAQPQLCGEPCDTNLLSEVQVHGSQPEVSARNSSIGSLTAVHRGIAVTVVGDSAISQSIWSLNTVAYAVSQVRNCQNHFPNSALVKALNDMGLQGLAADVFTGLVSTYGIGEVSWSSASSMVQSYSQCVSKAVHSSPSNFSLDMEGLESHSSYVAIRESLCNRIQYAAMFPLAFCSAARREGPICIHFALPRFVHPSSLQTFEYKVPSDQNPIDLSSINDVEQLAKVCTDDACAAALGLPHSTPAGDWHASHAEMLHLPPASWYHSHDLDMLAVDPVALYIGIRKCFDQRAGARVAVVSVLLPCLSGTFEQEPALLVASALQKHHVADPATCPWAHVIPVSTSIPCRHGSYDSKNPNVACPSTHWRYSVGQGAEFHVSSPASPILAGSGFVLLVSRRGERSGFLDKLLQQTSGDKRWVKSTNTDVTTVEFIEQKPSAVSRRTVLNMFDYNSPLYFSNTHCINPDVFTAIYRALDCSSGVAVDIGLCDGLHSEGAATAGMQNIEAWWHGPFAVALDHLQACMHRQVPQNVMKNVELHKLSMQLQTNGADRDVDGERRSTETQPDDLPSLIANMLQPALAHFDREVKNIVLE